MEAILALLPIMLILLYEWIFQRKIPDGNLILWYFIVLFGEIFLYGGIKAITDFMLGE